MCMIPWADQKLNLILNYFTSHCSDPFEHYVLPPCQGVPVVVYDHEPSSIIAYSLR